MGIEQILLVAAIVIYVIVKRFAGSPVGGQSLLLPLALTGYGIYQLAKADPHGLGGLAIGLIAIQVVVAIGAGAARAATIKLYVRDGHLWQRYSLLTLAVWIGMIAVRFGIMAAGSSMGAHVPEAGTIEFAFGLSILVESLLISMRASATGTPILPRQSRNDRRSDRRSRIGIR